MAMQGRRVPRTVISWATMVALHVAACAKIAGIDQDYRRLEGQNGEGGTVSGGSGGSGSVAGNGGVVGDGDAGPVATADSFSRFDSFSFQRGNLPHAVGAPGVLANDAPGLSVVAGEVATEQGGAVSLAADGSFSYAPPSSIFWGDDHFEYRLPPGGVARVRLTVQPGDVQLEELLEPSGNGFAMHREGVPGYAVSSAGDVNADGFGDLLVGAAGEAYVVFGSAAIRGRTLDLATAGGLTITQEGAIKAAAGVGDVNGDGLDDLLVGDLVVGSAGSSYVVFGKASAGAVVLTTLASLGEGFVIDGVNLDDNAGASLSAAGDVNGDGLADLVIGAPYAQVSAGEAYVVFGKRDVMPVALAELGGNGFAIRGALGIYDNPSIHVAGVGDVNGDGLDDVAVDISHELEGEPGRVTYTGNAFVVFGKPDGENVALDDLQDKGFTFIGANLYDVRVSKAGDVNGDGLDDVILGVPAMRAAYVVFGRTSVQPLALDAIDSGAPGSGGFTIHADAFEVNDATPSVGLSASGAGDVDGDGLADVVIASWTAEGGTSGKGHIVFGKSGGEPLSLRDLVGQGFAFSSPGDGDLSGASVSSAGDFNADGLSDVAIGAWNAGDGFESTSYMLFGWDVRQKLGSRDTALVAPRGDALEFTGAPLLSVAGGHRVDTLRFTGADLTLDLRNGIPSLRSIEVIDLTGTGNNLLVLADAAVRRVPQTRAPLPGGLVKTLVMLGDAGDRVELDTSYEDAGMNADRRVLRKPGGRYGIELAPGIELSTP